jgi:tetratricopeptide (TPR) repeat protein
MRILVFTTIVLLLSACSFTQKIKSGEQAYDLKRYDLAVSMLQDEYEGTGDRAKARKAYLLGQSYAILKEDREAARWYGTAVRAGYGNDADLALAKTLRRLERYDDAITLLTQLQSRLPGEPAVQRQLAMARQAAEWASRPRQDIQVTKESYNSGRADYGGVFINDEYLVFTSDRDEATGTDVYDWTGNKYSDLFVVHKDGSSPLPYDGLLNSKYNDGTPALTQDKEEMYFTRCFSDDPSAEAQFCRLMYSYKQEGLWTEPETIPFWEGSVSYGQPCLIENDSVLVFVAQREEGRGGYDLYYSVLDDGRWAEPYTMPASINTEGNEYFPTADGDTLYFSSDYLMGMGGLDIFKTYLRADGSWAPPQNLMPPINSGADDFHYLVDRSSPTPGRLMASGYLSSSRAGDTDDDIYKWRQYQPVADTMEVVTGDDDDPSSDLDVYLAGVVVTDVFAVADDPNSGKRGTAPVPQAYIKIGEEDGFTTDDAGRFLVKVSLDQLLELRASKRGFLNNLLQVDTRNLPVEEGQSTYTINVTIPLDQIFSGVEIVLDNIYYDFDKWDIRPDAEPALKTLVKILKTILRSTSS